jgi:hypothetical protein
MDHPAWYLRGLSCLVLMVGVGLHQHEARAGQGFSYEDYAEALSEYVDGEGMVNYEALKKNRGGLDNFVTSLGEVSDKEYNSWSEHERIAFLINAYNAITLKVIVDHYPIKKGGLLASLRFPASSIRQIDGVWDEIRHPVVGRKVTLDEIEHKNLRANFSEPRIHFALVCAAMGCPPLRDEPYTGDALDEQLDDQARTFLHNREKFRVDRSGGTVYLSPIFKWFKEDWEKVYAPEGGFRGFDKYERAVLNFISAYLDKRDKGYLISGDYSLSYLDYDWSLNEQVEGKK